MENKNHPTTVSQDVQPQPRSVRFDAKTEAPHAAAASAVGEDTLAIDLSYLDPIDLAIALSFPASDPPAFSQAD